MHAPLGGQKEQPLSHTQMSYDNPDGIEDVSQIRKQFNAAFAESEPSESDHQSERIKQLEEQVKELRAKAKRGEQDKKTYQEISKRKDEDIKRVQEELSAVEKKYEDVQQSRQRDKTLIM